MDDKFGRIYIREVPVKYLDCFGIVTRDGVTNVNLNSHLISLFSFRTSLISIILLSVPIEEKDESTRDNYELTDVNEFLLFCN